MVHIVHLIRLILRQRANHCVVNKRGTVLKRIQPLINSTVGIISPQSEIMDVLVLNIMTHVTHIVFSGLL